MVEGIKGILAKCSDCTIVAEALSAIDVVPLAARAVADLLLIEPTIANGDATKLICSVREVAPFLAILFCETRPSDCRAIDLIRAGAQGCVSKRTTSNDFVAAIRKVACGRLHVDEETAEQIAIDLSADVRNNGEECPLSTREKEVLLLLANGHSVTRIGHEMNLSVKTVSTHKSRLLVKLGLKGTSDLVLYAMRHHFITVSAECGGPQ